MRRDLRPRALWSGTGKLLLDTRDWTEGITAAEAPVAERQGSADLEMELWIGHAERGFWRSAWCQRLPVLYLSSDGAATRAECERSRWWHVLGQGVLVEQGEGVQVPR